MNNTKSIISPYIVIINGKPMEWHIDLDYHPKSSELGFLIPREGLEGEMAKYWLDHKMPWIHSRYDLFRVAVDKTKHIEGLYLDFGTLTGTCANAIAELIPDKIVYGFDSWKGYPAHFGIQVAGAWAIPRPNSKDDPPDRKIEQYRVLDNVKLIIGYFEETLIPFLEEKNQKINLIHIDCDLYSSTKYVLFNCIKYIQKGTIIQFNGLFNRMKIDNIIYWMKDESLAWEEFINSFNVKFNYLGSQSVSASMEILDFKE